MVRERVGDWRLAWRFALAGLIAGMLVTAFGYFGLINRSFDAAQDQLFPAPSPDPRITLVAIDQKSNDRPRPEFANFAAAVGERGFATPDAADSIRGVEIHPTQTCPQNEAQEPAFLQALRISQGINSTLSVNAAGTEATFGPHHIPLVANQMLINFTKGGSPTCPYVDALNASCPHPEAITNHIVVVGLKLIDAGDVYSQ